MAAGTPAEYIRHHLQNLTYGRHPDGSWGLARSAEEAADMGFMAIHVDTMFWSALLGGLFLWLFRRVAVSMSIEKPGRLQSCIEVIVQMVDNSVKETFHGKNPLIAPLALTLFVWIFLMNFMDLIPVDFIPHATYLMGIEYMKVVPTTDVNATFGLAFAVFFLMIYYSIKVKGGRRILRRTGFPPIRQGIAAGQPGAGTGVTVRQAAVAVVAVVRQPVCRGVDLHPDRGPDTVLGAMDSFRALGDLPYPGDHPASLYFHDVDDCLSQYVP